MTTPACPVFLALYRANGPHLFANGRCTYCGANQADMVPFPRWYERFMLAELVILCGLLLFAAVMIGHAVIQGIHR